MDQRRVRSSRLPPLSRRGKPCLRAGGGDLFRVRALCPHTREQREIERKNAPSRCDLAKSREFPFELSTVTASILGGLGFYLHSFTPRSRAPEATMPATAQDKPGTFTREALVKKSREQKAHRTAACQGGIVADADAGLLRRLHRALVRPRRLW